ncbi:dipeptidyl-peptidase IV Serine peptidase. MEROPS family S09B [Sphingomonas carotinifaciens]|uniref:Dipeptidyl-peptidase IV Serine peptidase. MEROPS family S09B n=2 Tax=Sphingomonas carotinifaciens TaxID=1166323 RepID=A0A1G7ID78_9SPHN|nr:prolyl oligopeptidase family serine peptidase [Sphingomonas carotinifaciens]SDF10456.1 dipeptidyl-peptidase IV Serine peptidase. MEROPS family S09B [Sphingomonas carotinifaciens]
MRAWVLGLALASVGTAAMMSEQVQAADRSAIVPAKQGELTLGRVFGNPDLSGSQPRGLRLSPDGTLLTFLRARADERERLDLWARDTRTGAERMLVDSKAVGTGAELSEAEKMQRERARIGGSKGIVTYDWAPDGKTILVPLDGDLYLATLDGQVRRLTNTAGGELNPVVSPRGGFVSFVRDQNLWAVPLGGGEARPLTTEGRGTVHFGEAEFVAQEEMHRFTGYWWSPDERFVAVERFDEAPVQVAVRAAIGATGTKVYEQRYPGAGTPNALVDLYVMRPDGSGKVKVDLGSDPDIYLARVDWLPDGSALLVQRQSRDQKTLDMLRVDPATGKSTVLFTEKSGERSWLNLSDAYHVMKDGSLVWRSERSGFGHLYRYKGGKWTALTKGDWVVTNLVGVDEGRGRLYFTGTKDDVLEQHLYALDLNKPGSATRLTERGYTNAASMDDGASRFIISRSGPRQPTQVYLADTTGKRLEWINENAVAGAHPYAPYLASHQDTTFGTLKAKDGSVLHWEMITPPLEPGKKYPVFFQHYGGPGTGQQVTRGWQGALPQFLVDQGYIFFQIDNRGSYNRGKAFEDQIYHAMGTVEVEDQLTGAEYLKTLPFVDANKIATYGWSYGGYMSIKMLEKTPGVYAAAVSGAPVTDWQLYDTHYTERYLGDPRTDPQSYAVSQAVSEAAKIKDPLLLIHGMADDNVFLDNATVFATEMQKTDTPFEMMFYPGQTHRVGGPGVSEHLWTTILNFLDREVKQKPAK